MASVETYKTAKGERRYRARWRDENRRDKEKAGFRRKQDADNFLADVSAATRRGEYIDPSSGKTYISALGQGWLRAAEHRLKYSAYRVLESGWRKHVEPAWGRRRISEIRYSEVQSWLDELHAQGYSVTTLKRCHEILDGILETAVRDRQLASNPAKGVKFPKKMTKAPAFLTLEQLELVADESSEYRALVLVLGYVGLRWGEATALRVRHINFLRRRILVEENAVAAGKILDLTTPKTHRRREVVVPRFLVEELSRLVEGRDPDRLVFGNGVSHLRRPDSRIGWFEKALARAQLLDPIISRITLHDLRHTAASVAINNGANVKLVSNMLGHASAKMTLDVYASLFDSHADEVSDVVEAARAASIARVRSGARKVDER